MFKFAWKMQNVLKRMKSQFSDFYFLSYGDFCTQNMINFWLILNKKILSALTNFFVGFHSFQNVSVLGLGPKIKAVLFDGVVWISLTGKSPVSEHWARYGTKIKSQFGHFWCEGRGGEVCMSLSKTGPWKSIDTRLR